MIERRDAIVVGSGPNGLAAAIALARAGRSVLVLEAAATIGGGTRSAELTLPGFRHDVCSAIHPLALASPFLRSLPLNEHGLAFVHPEIPLAHPLDDGTAVALHRSVGETADGLGVDAESYRALMEPLTASGKPCSTTSWVRSTRPATRCRARASHAQGCARRRAWRKRASRATSARALLAGNAAHAMRPLDAPHDRRLRPAADDARARRRLAGRAGGLPGDRRCDGLAAALARRRDPNGLRGALARGRARRAGSAVRSHAAADRWRSPATSCPPATAAQLGRFRYGPGVFKLDYALAGPCPGRPRSAVAPGRCTWAGRSRRSRSARPRSRRAGMPRGRTCSSPSRACSIRAARRQGRTRCGPTATCRTARRVDMTRAIEAPDRALRAGLPRPRPGAQRDRARATWKPQRELHRRRHQRRRGRPAPAVRAARGEAVPTRRPTRASSSARRPRRPAAASTGCAAGTRRARPCAERFAERSGGDVRHGQRAVGQHAQARVRPGLVEQLPHGRLDVRRLLEVRLRQLGVREVRVCTITRERAWMPAWIWICHWSATVSVRAAIASSSAAGEAGAVSSSR